MHTLKPARTVTVSMASTVLLFGGVSAASAVPGAETVRTHAAASSGVTPHAAGAQTPSARSRRTSRSARSSR
ncbi:hypothetical protein ACH4U3_39735 [Streptomyces griseoruber]|uniref:hypothetical protein n=1 Tax=Streptomyces griseoruber TaxID=1943 RepID=UPI0037AFF8CE